MAAAAGNEISDKSPLKRETGEGDITCAGAKTVTLDGSYLDCMTACSFVILQMIAAKAAQQNPADAFYRFWSAMQRRVSAGGSPISSSESCATVPLAIFCAAGSLYSPEIAYPVNCSRYGSAAAGGRTEVRRQPGTQLNPARGGAIAHSAI